jgi:hypothetical protein
LPVVLVSRKEEDRTNRKEEHVHEEEQLNLMRGVSRTKGERVSRKGE